MPGAFAYNTRVAVASVPALAVVLGFGGNLVAGVSVCGVVAVYFLDYFRQREGALAAMWITLAAVNLCLIVSESGVDVGGRPLLLCLLSFLCCTTVLFHTGCWGTVQFRWVQMQYPPVVLAMERLVLNGGVTMCAPIIAWGCVAAVGAASAPFYLAVALPALFYALCTPLPSSFYAHSGGAAASRKHAERQPGDFAAQGKVETACAAVLTAMLPSAMYAGIHWDAMTQSMHMWSLLLLTSGPLLAVLSSPGGIWWSGLNARAASLSRWTCTLICLGAFVAGVEGRILFVAFREYISIQPPWDWVVVTLAVYGHFAMVFLHFSGSLQSYAVYSVCLAGLLMSCVGACLTVGVPISIIPAPLISALGFGLYYRTTSLREYALFLAGCGITGLWFVSHHFWFLDISWNSTWNVQRICALLILYTAPTAMLPGLILSRAPPALIGIALVLQSGMLSLSEAALISGNLWLGEVYPAYAVIATSGIGLVISSQLSSSGRVLAWNAQLAQLIYACKAAMLLLVHPLQAFHVMFLVSVSSAAVLLHPAKAGTLRRQRLPPNLGLFYSGACLFCCWEVRHTMMDVVTSVIGNSPGEVLALGVLLLLGAVTLSPLVYTHYRHSATAKVAVLGLLALGVMLATLQPPLPLALSCHTQPRHGIHAARPCLRIFKPAETHAQEVDDIAVYGYGSGNAESWALWLLILGMLSGFAALGQTHRSRDTGVAARTALALMAGCSVGGYIAAELFPLQHTLQLLLTLTCVLVAAALVFVSLPMAGTSWMLPPTLLLWSALLPVAFFMEHESTPAFTHHRRLYPDAITGLEDEQRTFRYASLLAVYGVQSALLAFCIKMKVSQHEEGGPRASHDNAGVLQRPTVAGGSKLSSFLGTCLPEGSLSMATYHRAMSKASCARSALFAEGLGWLPAAGNLITLLCYAACIGLDTIWFAGSEVMILPLSSILLLLNQDAYIFPTLRRPRRYVPPLASAAAYLTLTGISGSIGMMHMHADALQRSPLLVCRMAPYA